MEFYFFSTVPARHKNTFKELYSRQNLKAVRISAGIIFTIATSLLLLNLIFGLETLDARNTFFAKVNTLLVAATGLTFLASYIPKTNWKITQTVAFKQSVCFFFSVAYTLSCLSITFVQQKNPKNTLTMYLMSLAVVALLWAFEFWQHILFVFLIELAFIFGLSTLKLPANEIFMNGAASVFLFTFFFVTARMVYSFRANHFMQLAEIEEKNREIQRISQTKSEILGVVAHDLLSPFASIESFIRLFRRKNLAPEKKAEYLELVLAQCRSCRNLINDLLEAARDENEQAFLTQTTEMNEFLAEVQTKWQMQLKDSRNISFTKTSQPVYAALNKERFHRVIDNLVSNAVKFTPQNGQINLELFPEKDQIQLHISDNGIGIPQNLQPFLFERFTKARRTGLQGEESTGLGLSITQQLVQKHGGSIAVTSAEAQGTAFQITLPTCANENSN